MTEKAAPWPALRDELGLSPGPSTEHGAPTWTLHDPAGHRFFRLGWLEFEVLSRWAMGSAEAIREALLRETTLEPELERVQAVHDFALRNCLLRAATPEDTARLMRFKDLGKTSLGHKIVHGYLFFRIPLLSPDAWLTRLEPYTRCFFSRGFLAFLACCCLLGLYLVSREWVAFMQNREMLWTWQRSLTVLLAIGLAKTVHELGHAMAAKRLGLRVPRMGIALMCFTPVLWTDVTEAWKLPERSHRLLIDLSGVGAELALATAASLLWPLLPPGEAKSAVLTLAGVTWLTTLTINANPFMRYDGYYLLSDLWEVPGLQQRAFALARWRLRELVFGFGDAQPEALPAGLKPKLLIYAYGTWLYRFFLFMGIALLVYHLFFKVLGLILMLVEVIWFIALPIYKELAAWHARRAAIRLTRQTVRSALLFCACVALFFIPWHTRVEGPALLAADRSAALYAQQPAKVAAVPVRPGQEVREGQVLLTLASPDLEGRIAIARRRLATLREKLAASSLDTELRLSYGADMQEMLSVTSELTGLTQEHARLTVRAPLDGVFRDLPAWVGPGTWVPRNMKLGIVTQAKGLVTAYVAEEDMERLATGMTGKFYPGSGLFPPLPLRVVALEHAATRDIPHSELPSTVNGGIIPARRTPDGRIVPEQALYKVLCRVESGPVPTQSLTGTAQISGKRRSFAVRFWKAALGVLIRESGLE